MRKFVLYDHTLCVSICSRLAYDLTPFNFEIAGGELILQVHEPKLRYTTRRWLEHIDPVDMDEVLTNAQ